MTAIKDRSTKPGWRSSVAAVLLFFGVLGIIWAPPGVPTLIANVTCVAGMVSFLASDPSSVSLEKFVPPNLSPEVAERLQSIRNWGGFVSLCLCGSILAGLASSWLRSSFGEARPAVAALSTVLLVGATLATVLMRRRFRRLLAVPDGERP